MRVKLLPSTFDATGRAMPEQRLSCYLVDGLVAVDAGSIALSLSDAERARVRDVIVTHPHMDHIATLPILMDDLFGSLERPVRVHATQEVIQVLTRDVFNGTVYPPFHEFSNERTHVMEFVPLRSGEEFRVEHLRALAVPVNHTVPTVGLVLTDGRATVAFSSDTSATEELWQVINRTPRVDALLVEASFPNALAELAERAGHLTPAALGRELGKLSHKNLDILAVHLKAVFREQLVREIDALGVPRLSVMRPGRDYSW